MSSAFYQGMAEHSPARGFLNSSRRWLGCSSIFLRTPQVGRELGEPGAQGGAAPPRLQGLRLPPDEDSRQVVRRGARGRLPGGAS